MPLLDQFMTTYQEEAEEFGDAADEVTHTMGRMKKVLNDKEDLLSSKDASKGTRARSQDTATRPKQCSPSKYTMQAGLQPSSGTTICMTTVGTRNGVTSSNATATRGEYQATDCHISRGIAKKKLNPARPMTQDSCKG